MEGEKTKPDTSGADNGTPSRPEPSGTSAPGTSQQAENPAEDEELEFDSFFSTRKPKDFKAGLSSGMKSIGKGVLAGVAGLVVAPIAGAKKEGVVGAAKGLASGVVGAVVLPTVGVGVAGYQMTRGALNTPEAVREAAQGKEWDPEKREWVDTPTDAVAVDDPVYADARARYQKARTEANGKTFPYYYEVLGVSPTATEAEIKKAYYVKARQCHPDKKKDDELANEQFQQLGEAYQVLSNPDLRTRYDAKQDVSGDTDLMASGEFFAMLFGSMRFEEFVGELMISTLARFGGEVTREQVEKVQGLRVETVKDNLLVYIDSLWSDSNDMFDMHMKNLATEKLATAEYGPMMLTTLGKVYKLQAKRAQGNFAAYWRQQGNKIGSTWSAVSTAMKVMQHQKNLEKNADPTSAGESQKEQLKLMLDAMWATNALDIQNTVAKACAMALNDKQCSREQLKQRATALEHMGTIFLEVGNAALEASAGKSSDGSNQQDVAAQRIEKALQETLEKMDREERGNEPSSSTVTSP